MGLRKSKKKLFDVRWIQSWLQARPVVVERARNVLNLLYYEKEDI